MYELKKSIQSPTAQEIARLLGRGREKLRNGVWYTHCPAHEDSRPDSLRLSDRRGFVAVSCRDGCEHAHVRGYIHAEIAQIATRATQYQAQQLDHEMHAPATHHIYIDRSQQIKQSLQCLQESIKQLAKTCWDCVCWTLSEIKEG